MTAGSARVGPRPKLERRDRWKSTALPLLYAAIALQTVQLLFFNLSTEPLRLTMAALAFGCSAMVAILCGLNGRRGFGGFWLVAAAMLLSWLGAWGILGASSSAADIAQDLSMVTWPIACLSLAHRLRPLPLALCAGGVVLTAGVVVLLSPAISFAGDTRPASFTGGAFSPHSSAYAIAGAVLVLAALLPRYAGAAAILLRAAIGLGVALVVAYESRTALAMLIAATAAALLYRLLRSGGPLAVLPFLPLAAAAAILLASSAADWNEVSSGRLAVYGERLASLRDGGAGVLAFGRGAGSDLMSSDQWWWAAKVSHNDFLTALTERGLIGGMALIVYLIVLFSRTRRAGRFVVLAIATGAMLSGILDRPLSLYLLFLAMALHSHAPKRLRAGDRRRYFLRRRGTLPLAAGGI